jgi:hypothetical protein
MQLGGVAIGTPIASVRNDMGDPLGVKTGNNGTSIWRYLPGSGGWYLDLLVKNYVVISATVLARFQKSAYVDSRGIAFGSSAADVRAKLGTAAHENTNADDGSLDLWYAEKDGYRIYEFVNDKLGFVQIVNAHRRDPAPGPEVVLGDGSSFERAVRVGPADVLSGTTWIGAYVHAQPCGKNGLWVQADSPGAGMTTHDEIPYRIVRATCSEGGSERDFYFDERNFSLKAVLAGTASTPNTVYVDVSSLGPAAAATPSPAPPSAPAAAVRGGSSFDDAIVITASSEPDGVRAEYAYLAAHPCDGGTWKLGKQALATHASVPYDILSVTCSSGGAARDFYFDIRSFFGKD